MAEKKFKFLLKWSEMSEGFQLPEKIIVGRTRADLNFSEDVQMSSQHAQITIENQKPILRDLGSTNGTFVNNERIAPQQPRELFDHDAIRMGKHEFVLLIETLGMYEKTQAHFDPLASKDESDKEWSDLGTAMVDQGALPSLALEVKQPAVKKKVEVRVHVMEGLQARSLNSGPAVIPAKPFFSTTTVMVISVILALSLLCLLYYLVDVFVLKPKS